MSQSHSSQPGGGDSIEPAGSAWPPRVPVDPPATLLLHKPVAVDPQEPDFVACVGAEARWESDPCDMAVHERHFGHLSAPMPLEPAASGLQVLTQDGRVRRRLLEDADAIEQEYLVEVAGEIAPYGLHRMQHGLAYRGRVLPPCKVSWQNEVRLRFALKAVRPGQLADMCAQVGLQAVAIRRLRIGRIPLLKMPVGAWRYLPAGERF